MKKWLCKICGAACRHKRTVGIVAAVLAFLLVMGLIPAVLWPDEAKTLVLEWLQFAAYLVGAVFVVQQLRISNRRATALEKTAALGEKGNITERFKNAIEHLGSGSESIRMGGIYGLYHVVRESRGYADTVLKILCAHAKSIMAKPGYTEKEKPSNEIAAILDILFPIDNKDKKQNADVLFVEVDISDWHLHGANANSRNMRNITGKRVKLLSANLSDANLADTNLADANLSGANLAEADLSDANLADTNLAGAVLSGAVLSGAILSKSDLSDAILLGANLLGAGLSDANLASARLERAKLTGARLARADLSDAILSSAVLSSADLSDANLAGANLAGADLAGAILSDAILSGTNLAGVDLSDANLSNVKLLGLSGADLSGAYLPRADLSGADLSDSDLSGANLSEVDLSNADLSKADLSEAIVTVGYLLEAKTLYKAKLDDHIREEILRHKPELLNPPADSPDEKE